MDCRRPSSVCIHVGWRLLSTGSCGDKGDLEVHATPPPPIFPISTFCIHVGWRLLSTGSCGDKGDLEVHATSPPPIFPISTFRGGGACWRKGFFGKVKCDEWKTGFRISLKWLQPSHLQFLHYLFIDFSILIYPGDPFFSCSHVCGKILQFEKQT